MAALRYTPLRHRMLAEVGAGRIKVYVGLQWNLLREGEFMKGAERKTADQIRSYVQHVVAFHRHVAAKLNDAGASLLSEWNTKYGDPLATEVS